MEALLILLYIISFYIVMFGLVIFFEKLSEVVSLKRDKESFYKEKNQFIEDKNRVLMNIDFSARELKARESNIISEKEKIKKEREGIRAIAQERQKGCPWLEDEYDRFFALMDGKAEYSLIDKPNPAYSSATKVKEANQRRRRAERNERIYKNLVDYYESIAPFLVDLKEEVINEDDIQNFQEYTEEEKRDKVVEFLTIDEYHKLSTIERNQLALDRYWKRPKSKSHIGRVYERFIGYQYENKGFDVKFEGIFKGLEDLGRDLICQKGKNIHIVQCKYWSQFKTIHEKHIFQLFGTMYQYKKKLAIQNKDCKIIGLFCTTTKVSDLAKEFATDIGIKIKDNFAMNYEYPCIKCNINPGSKEKIYHLPFDQMYDRVKIDIKNGEFYCKTVKEAEEKGFRRAMRHFLHE